jgi:hypothetical protein
MTAAVLRPGVHKYRYRPASRRLCQRIFILQTDRLEVEIPDVAGSAQQLFDAIDQALDRERLNQIFNVMLGQEECDFCVGGKAGDENETIGQ